MLVAIQYPLPPAGVLSLESAAASVEEGSTLSLSVARRDGTYGEASVSYRVAYGSADAKDVAPLTGTLNWAAGQSDSQTISIPVKSDTLHEGDETFTLELFEASGAALGEQHQTLVTIKDKLAPSTIALARASMMVNEGQWFAEIPRVRTGDLSKPARARVSLEGITARWGLDFLPWFGQSVSWAAGEGGSKSIKVLILDDWFVESTEQFKVSLRQLQGGKPGVGFQVGQHRINTGGRAGNGAVDALARQQQRALHPMRLAHRLQRWFQAGVIGQIDKLVQGGNGVGAGRRR